MEENQQVCTRCKKLKPLDRFKMCPKCRALLRGQYYRLRQDNEVTRGQWMADMKAKMKCHDCQTAYPDDPRQLTWDHRPGEIKLDNISDMVFKGLVDEVLEEIKKCDLVCPKCHARRGIERGQIRSGPQTTGECQYCHNEFRYTRSARRKYCSRTCANRARYQK